MIAKNAASKGMISPGDTIGILGGGQLGRMLALAAARYGLKSHIYCPDADSPAFEVAAFHTCASYDDEAALARFAESVAVVTYEFENVPGRTAEIVAGLAPLHPNPRALAITQDRLAEKSFVADLGIATAPFQGVVSEAELAPALHKLGRPSVLKTRRFGYDGKGQVILGPDSDPAVAWAAVGRVPSILERFVPFEREVSVVAARAASGEVVAYDLCANEHRVHILDVTRVPAGASPEVETAALTIAARIAAALDYVGVLAVEMFLMRPEDGGTLVVNEIAPRVHNSGHWTIEGAATSQFEQHVRAICGWPLGATRRLGRAEMRNLIGDDVGTWPDLVAEKGAHLHLYGKAEGRPGRKMGHVTRVWPEE